MSKPLRVKRTSCRKALTRTINETTEEMTSEQCTVSQLTVALDRVEKAFANLQTVDDLIEAGHSDELDETEYDGICQYNDEAVTHIARLKVALASKIPAPQPNPPAATTPTVVAQPPRRHRVEQRKFSGKHSQWLPFWESFRVQVHDDPQIPDVTKFQLLEQALQGSASNVIAGLPPTSANYSIAVDLLSKRYGDTQILQQEHMANLSNVPMCNSVDDVFALRKIYDTVTMNVRALRTLGMTDMTLGPTVYIILTRCLPNDILFRFHRERKEKRERVLSTASTSSLSPCPDESPDGIAMLDYLGEEVTFRERCTAVTKQSRRQEPTASSKRQETRLDKHKPSSASLLHINDRKSDAKCVICESASHKTELCDAKLTVQEKKQKLLGRCFKCTGTNHLSRECRRNIVCSHCKGRHATTLCSPRGQSNQSNSSDSRKTAVTSLYTGKASGTTLLQTAAVWAKGQGPPAQLRLLFDGGSDRTFIDAETAQQLNCEEIGSEKLSLETFGRRQPEKEYKRVQLVVWSRHDSSNERHKLEALVVPYICQQVQPHPSPNLVPLSLQLADADINDGTINLLVGCDSMYRLTRTNIQRIPNTAAVAIDTVFGWTVTGCFGTPRASPAHLVTSLHISNADLDHTLRRFWELEAIGISMVEDDDNTTLNVPSYRESAISNIEGRYEVALPWRVPGTRLDPNLVAAQARLTTLTRRLQQNEDTLRQYHSVIEDYADSGFIEAVPHDIQTAVSYYMPHRGVFRDSSTTTQLRVVYDASSHRPGALSLNDALHAGPSLNPNLVGVLLRFRVHRVAITADIAKAFLQVSIAEEDRDVLRFLWYSSLPLPNQALPPLTHYRFCRLPFGVTSSPFILAAVVQTQLDKWRSTYPDTVAMIEQNLYVDDLLAGASTIEEGQRIYNESKAIFADAGMNLRKWASNEQQLCQVFAANQDLEDGHEIVASSEILKVLGLVWHSSTDRLSFNLSAVVIFLEERANTKRFLLKAASRIFDPLGWLAPFIIRVKIMFQQLWEIKAHWDEPLPEAIQTKWTEWCDEVALLETVSVPRAYHLSNENAVQELHIFSDASPLAYGAVVYLRVISAGSITVNLVMAKSRVAPLKKLTIPRLELTGAVVAVRLAKFVSNELHLNFSSVRFWTDSSIVLSWINASASEWKPYVSNRIEEIIQNSSPLQWNHVAGSDNPADLLTRGITAHQLSSSQLWSQGPAWLSESAHPGIGDNFPFADMSEVTSELRSKNTRTSANAATAMAATSSSLPPPNELTTLAAESFSSLPRLLRVTAMVLRFVDRLRERALLRRTGGERPSNDQAGPLSLSTADLRKAERFWIRRTQQESFAGTLHALQKGDDLPRNDKLRELQPYLDESGVMRLKGRLPYLSAPDRVLHPILLPKDHNFTALIIASAHHRLLHCGVNDVMSHIRERFWVLSLRSITRKVVRACITCRRFHARPLTAPTAPLPAPRSNEADCFEIVGVDFAGPLLTKRQKKCYICLFTCAVSRALHLELVEDLETTTFLSAFRRFASRRGVPRIIYSDNALTFKRASRDLDLLQTVQVVQQHAITSYCAAHGIEWRFNVPRAPWWGGFWERLVQSVKLALKKVLGSAVLTYNELATTLCEVEAVLNSRPLTYNEADEIGILPLTPAELLTGGRRLTSLPDPDHKVVSGEQDRNAFVNRWTLRKRTLSGFWIRWRQEYLLRLRSAHFAAPGRPASIGVGDIVIVNEPNTPRLHWKLARVTELHAGRDGQIRSATILFDGRELKRPVQLLYPLEVNE